MGTKLVQQISRQIRNNWEPFQVIEWKDVLDRRLEAWVGSLEAAVPIPLKQHRQYAVSDPESAEDILKLAGVQGYADVVEEDGVEYATQRWKLRLDERPDKRNHKENYWTEKVDGVVGAV